MRSCKDWGLGLSILCFISSFFVDFPTVIMFQLSIFVDYFSSEKKVLYVIFFQVLCSLVYVVFSMEVGPHSHILPFLLELTAGL